VVEAAGGRGWCEEEAASGSGSPGAWWTASAREAAPPGEAWLAGGGGGQAGSEERETWGGDKEGTERHRGLLLLLDIGAQIFFNGLSLRWGAQARYYLAGYGPQPGVFESAAPKSQHEP